MSVAELPEMRRRLDVVIGVCVVGAAGSVFGSGRDFSGLGTVEPSLPQP
jgi:hypothetical protein